jgi:hypothetical protein
MKKIIIVFILFQTIPHSWAQNFEIGGEFGFGKTTTMGIGDLFEQYGNTENNYKVGILASFNPNHTILYINSGLLFQMKGNDQGYMENLKIPIGLDLFFDKKNGPLFGGGVYLNYFFNTTEKVYSYREEKKRDVQFGAFFDLGGKVQITNFLNIAFKFQIDFDLTPLYQEGSYSAGGWLDGYDNVKSQEYSLNLCIMYCLHKKSKK